MSTSSLSGPPADSPEASHTPVGLDVVPAGPRLALAGCGILALALTPSTLGAAFQIALLLVLAASIGRLTAVVRGWRTIAAVSASLLVVYSWAYPGSTDFVWIFGVQGFFAALFIVVRLVGFVTVLQVLLVSTGQVALVEWAGDRNEDLGVMISLTLSVVPVMRQQMHTTMQAQEARGLDTHGSLPTRARAYLGVLIPVVVKSLVRAYGMATLLHVRGYGSGRRIPEPTPLTLAVFACYASGAAWVVAAAIARVRS